MTCTHILVSGSALQEPNLRQAGSLPTISEISFHPFSDLNPKCHLLCYSQETSRDMSLLQHPPLVRQKDWETIFQPDPSSEKL